MTVIECALIWYVLASMESKICINRNYWKVYFSAQCHLVNCAKQCNNQLSECRIFLYCCTHQFKISHANLVRIQKYTEKISLCILYYYYYYINMSANFWTTPHMYNNYVNILEFSMYIVLT